MMGGKVNMKIQTITTYDKSRFCDALEQMYQNYVIERVDTHTEVKNERGVDLIYYIAIVFFKDKETSHE